MRALSLFSLLVVGLLPFERIPTVEAFGYTVKLSYIAALLLLGAACWSWVTTKKKRQFGQEEVMLGVLWVIALLSITQSPTPVRSMVIAALWLFMFLIYAVIRRLFTDQALRLRAERVLFVVTAVVCLFGLYQFVGDMLGLSMAQTGLRDWYTKEVLGFTRIQSTALEPLYFSNFLLFPLFLLFARMMTAKKPSPGQVALSALIVTNIVLGVSRGAYLALIVSVGLLIGYLVYSISKKQLGGHVVVPVLASLVLGVGSALVLLGSLAPQSAITSFVGHAQVEDAPTSDSVAGRKAVYTRALDLFAEKPMLGIGIGAFGPRTKGSEQELAKYGYGLVNNEYLEILTETGVLGALAFFGFVLAFLKSWMLSFRRAGEEKRLRLVTLGLGIVAIAIQYNFFSTLYTIWIWVFLAWLMAEANQQA